MNDPDGAIELVELGVRAIGEGVESLNDRQDRDWWKWIVGGLGLVCLVVLMAYLGG